MIHNYVDNLKDCTLEKEVHKIMKNRVYPGSKNSKFEDTTLLLPDSAGFFKPHNIRLKGEFNLVFKLLIFMRFDGLLDNESLNSGKSNYFNEFQSILELIQNIDNNIKCIKDINHNVLIQIIENHQETDYTATTLNKKISRLKEWINFANSNLPYFLQLDNDLLTNVSNYNQLQENAAKEKNDSRKIGGPKKPYPLTNIKCIVQESIKYIEDFSEEILYMTETLVDGKELSGNKKYSLLFDVLEEADFNFKQPTLAEYKERLNNVHKKFEKTKGKTLNKLLETCINLSTDLEASCVIVILLLSGMRKSELLKLNRFPKTFEDEYYNLSRLIYKTSEDEEGEELEIPIPFIARKALEVLSKLSTLKDKQTTGRILTISVFSKKEESYVDRPNALIKQFCRRIGIIEEPRPHQLRHTMAFLIAYENEKNGLELARLFLGHKSISMTLQYMGHYNPLLQNAINELNVEKSSELINAIEEEFKSNHKFYGANSNLLMGNYKFTGSYADGYADLITKSLKELLKKGKIMIIQSATNLCIHDLTKKELMSCQRGLKNPDTLGLQPIASRCEGANCFNSIFFEKHMEKLSKEPSIEEGLRKRLMKNSYFADFNFSNLPQENLIYQYNKDKGII